MSATSRFRASRQTGKCAAANTAPALPLAPDFPRCGIRHKEYSVRRERVLGPAAAAALVCRIATAPGW